MILYVLVTLTCTYHNHRRNYVVGATSGVAGGHHQPLRSEHSQRRPRKLEARRLHSQQEARFWNTFS